MDAKIIKEEQNPLFNRKEIYGLIKADIIPSKKEVAEFLSKKYSVPVETIRILKIQGKFGVKEFELSANIYSTSEEKDKIENLSKKEKESEKKLIEEKNKPQEEKNKPEQVQKSEKAKESEEPETEVKTPAEEAIGINPVEEAKKVEEKKQEEDKKEKQKSKEEKLNE